MDWLAVGRGGTAPAGPRGAPGGARLTALGYVGFTLGAGLATLFARGWWVAGLLLIELLFGFFWSRVQLRIVRRPRFWLFLITAAAVGPFLIGVPDMTLGPLHLSREGCIAGLEMAGRAAALMLAGALGIGALSLSQMVGLFERLGTKGLGFATGLALNMLSTLQAMVTVTAHTIRLRAGLRRPWVALRLFLVTTIANTLRYSDDVVCAAAARGFDPQGQVEER